MDGALRRTVAGRYGTIGFFANDVGAIGRSLALYGEWAENEIDFVRQFIQPGATVLDIGAYVGTHTLAFARAVGATGSVIAFEPQPSSFALLSENVAANQVGNVRLENAAVSDSAGTISIAAIDIGHEGSFGSASLRDELHGENAGAETGRADPWRAHAGMVDVRAMTVDGLALDRCDLMKIDAEGEEDVIIRGATETLGRLKPVIYAECNSVAGGLRTIDALHKAGYAMRLHLVDAFNPRNFNAAEENVFSNAREAAILAVPAERAEAFEHCAVQAAGLLLRIDTADDLALGLLNKPQYAEEILRLSRAAADGGVAWLNESVGPRSEVEGAQRDAEEAKRILADERAAFEARAAEIYAEAAKERAGFEARTAEAYAGFDKERAGFEERIAEAYAGFEKERTGFEERIAEAYAEFDKERAGFEARTAEIYAGFEKERAGFEERIAEAYAEFDKERVGFEERTTGIYSEFAVERAGFEVRTAKIHAEFAKERAGFEERSKEIYAEFAVERSGFEKRTAEIYAEFAKERAGFEIRTAETYAEFAKERAFLAAESAKERAVLTAEFAQERAILAAELDSAHAMAAAAMLQARLSRAEADAASREKEIAFRTTTELQSRLEVQLADSAHVAGELNQRIAAIYRSTSWRLTGPMRRVVRLFKR